LARVEIAAPPWSTQIFSPSALRDLCELSGEIFSWGAAGSTVVNGQIIPYCVIVLSFNGDLNNNLFDLGSPLGKPWQAEECRLPMIGQTLAHYEINGCLGEGGSGVVYRGRDLRLERPVAVKVLADARRTVAPTS
jgi:serine/threonine protein kinase